MLYIYWLSFLWYGRLRCFYRSWRLQSLVDNHVYQSWIPALYLYSYTYPWMSVLWWHTSQIVKQVYTSALTRRIQCFLMTHLSDCWESLYQCFNEKDSVCYVVRTPLLLMSLRTIALCTIYVCLYKCLKKIIMSLKEGIFLQQWRCFWVEFCFFFFVGILFLLLLFWHGVTAPEEVIRNDV